MASRALESENLGELPIRIRPVGGFYFGRAMFAAMFVFGSGVFLANIDQVLVEPLFWLLAALLIGLAFMLSRTFRVGVFLDEREMRIVGELVGGSWLPISFLESASGVSDRVASSLNAINDWAGYVASDSG